MLQSVQCVIMLDPVKLLLYANYYYGRVMGVINFEIDLKTGRARICPRATLYAVSVTTYYIFLVPAMLHNRVWKFFWGQINQFYEYVFLVVISVRIVCMFITLLSRWWQREQIISLIHSFRRMALQQPEVMRLWRRGLISKCVCGILTELFHTMWPIYGLWQQLNIDMTLSILAMAVFIALLNIVLTQYFFAMLNVHGHYVLFDRELRSILDELRSLELDPRRGVRELRSCALADRLDKLAHLQSDLQSVLVQMTRIFGIQALCVAFISHFTMVAGCFYSFLTIRYNLVSLDMINGGSVVLSLGLLVHIIDQSITFSITFFVLDRHAKLAQLLADYTRYEHSMDVRLQLAVSVGRVFCEYINSSFISCSSKALSCSWPEIR